MPLGERVEMFQLDNEAEIAARRFRPDQFLLIELIKVLIQYPGGLRRWSVMRAIRKAHENVSREIPQKLEDDVERTFRRFCADAKDTKTETCAAGDALFYRPKEKAGEVWCVYTDRAKAWLGVEQSEVVSAKCREGMKVE